MTDPVTSSGVAMDPRMNPAEDGSDHSPASGATSQDQLQVLGGEQQCAEADEEAEQVGGGDAGVAEQVSHAADRLTAI
jgi:hypothetical protein